MSEGSNTGRLEAFCDAVFAIAMTLLIIDVKIPHAESITTTDELWSALRHTLPAIFAFVLSFTVILITWVNLHAYMKSIHKVTGSFIYALGLLMLAVVFMPFPSSLLGEYIATDHAAPAVMLFNFTIVLNSVAWVLLGKVAISKNLIRHESYVPRLRRDLRFGEYSIALYAAFTLLAYWFPKTVAILTTFSWGFWLVLGIRIKHE